MPVPASKNMLHALARLQQKKYRDAKQLFLLSGLNAVTGYIEGKNWPQQAKLLLQDDRMEWLSLLPEQAAENCFTVSAADFSRIADEKMPQGIALVLPRPRHNLSNFEAGSGISLYLEQVNDPGNLGTILRTASWFGVRNVLLSSNSADPFQPKVVRAAAGFGSRLPVYEQIDANALQTLMETHNLPLFGTIVQHGSAPFKLAGGQSLLLAFGSEAHGLSQQVADLCSRHIRVPRTGTGESLNLAVAVGICLYGLTV